MTTAWLVWWTHTCMQTHTRQHRQVNWDDMVMKLPKVDIWKKYQPLHAITTNHYSGKWWSTLSTFYCCKTLTPTVHICIWCHLDVDISSHDLSNHINLYIVLDLLSTCKLGRQILQLFTSCVWGLGKSWGMATPCRVRVTWQPASLLISVTV